MFRELEQGIMAGMRGSKEEIEALGSYIILSR